MKKIILPLFFIFAALIFTACSKSGSTTERTGNPQQLKTLFQEDNYDVSDGKYYELDTIKAASEGTLMSCFGNNAGSSYTLFDLPDSPVQTVENPLFPPVGWQYKLREDEAVVLITELPPECKYFSFVNYIMFTEQKPGRDYTNSKGYFPAGNDEVGNYHPIFGSIGNSVNIDNVKYSGTSKFGGTAVVVISLNKTVTDDVVAKLNEAGYPEDMINIMPISSDIYKAGLEKGKDTFSFLGRVSQAADQDAYHEYMQGLYEHSTVYRITPKEAIASNPYDGDQVIPRGNGITEISLVEDCEKNLDDIRRSIIEKYEDAYSYEELTTEIAVPEGITAYDNDINAQGDNRDAAYLMTNDFTLNSDEDFVVVYGINHTSTGKGQYSNAVLYARPMLNGVCSVYDSMFYGSADEYLNETCKNKEQFYVMKMARTKTDDYTAVIEYSTGNEQGKYYGIDNGETIFMAFRSYLDKTGTGASYYEITYDRAIVFHKK